MNPTEIEIQRAVLNVLKRLVPRMVRVQSGTFRSKGAHVHAADAGTPDLLGFCSHGRIVAVEVKTPGKSATAKQSAFIADVVNAGGIAGVVSSVESAERLIRDGCADHASI